MMQLRGIQDMAFHRLILFFDVFCFDGSVGWMSEYFFRVLLASVSNLALRQKVTE